MKSNPNISKQVSYSITHFINNSLNDFNTLTSLLKPLSRASSQMNQQLKNRLLLAGQKDSKPLIKQLLSYFLRISELKGTSTIILTIISKIIGFVKMLETTETKQSLFQRNEETTSILFAIIDILTFLKGRYKQAETTLRIIQTTYSLIDARMLQFANYSLLTRIYSVCFECCESSPVIQNISVSALMALTQIVFASSNLKDPLAILTEMLEYLFQDKKFIWIKGKQLRGIIWDLVNISIKSFSQDQLEHLAQNRIIKLITEMYSLSVEKVFEQPEHEQALNLSANSRQQQQKNINFKKGWLPDFIRYYKTFIYFTKYLYIRGSNHFKPHLHLHIPRFKFLYSLKRSTKLYLFLEGVSLLITEESFLLIEDEQAIVLIDVFNKVAEDLTQSPQDFEIGTDSGDLYLQKMCGDFTKINDNDFAKLIKRTILSLRKRFEPRSGKIQSQPRYDQSERDNHVPLNKRWERLIKIIIRIIKHLTSLNLREGSNEQIVRKLVGELQFWFTICPTHKIQNIVLQDILNTSTMLQNRIQAIKASQCLQIGSNIIYGYYDDLDTFGLALIIRMIVGVKVSWEEGKGFDQLEEVCIMAEKLYTEQKIITSIDSFTKTIQAFVLCFNGVLADLEQPEKSQGKNHKSHHRRRYLKMVDQIFVKIKSVLLMNCEYFTHQWNFLSGFWISLASNKNKQIKDKAMEHLLPIIMGQLKRGEISQFQLLLLYQQIAKLDCILVSRHILDSFKQLVLSVSHEDGIVEMMKVLSLMMKTKGIQVVHKEIYEMVEMIIKESLFQVRSCNRVLEVIDFISFVSKDKSQEYKIVNLLWNVSDHLKMLAQQQGQDKRTTWKHLFKKIITLARISAYGETKQSSIHAFTQILGQSLPIIGEQLFSQILGEFYLELFYILMGFQDKAEASLDMIRVGIKNFIKISKKCLTIHIQTAKGLFRQVLSKLTLQIREGKYSTIQHHNELNVLLLYLKEILQNDLAHLSELRGQIKASIVQAQKVHQDMDKSTYSWRKYSVVFEEIKAFFLAE